jgi:hypothetical protein
MILKSEKVCRWLDVAVKASSVGKLVVSHYVNIFVDRDGSEGHDQVRRIKQITSLKQFLNERKKNLW